MSSSFSARKVSLTLLHLCGKSTFPSPFPGRKRNQQNAVSITAPVNKPSTHAQYTFSVTVLQRCDRSGHNTTPLPRRPPSPQAEERLPGPAHGGDHGKEKKNFRDRATRCLEETGCRGEPPEDRHERLFGQ